MINHSHKVITTGVETTLLCLANQAHRRGGGGGGEEGGGGGGPPGGGVGIKK